VILHCVHLALSDGYDRAELADVMGGLSELAPLQHGPNRDFEGKSQGFPYGLVARFNDAEAVARYAEDPVHKALGARLCELCDGGADGIVVYDLEVAA